MSALADDSDDTPTRRIYSVPAAEKVLDILEFMADRAEGLTATEIANQMGRSVHEIYRVLLLLEARGYLYQRAGSDGYRLSLKLFDLAHRLPSVRRLSDSALEELQDLTPKILQSCHLGVLNGHELLIVLQVDSPLPMRYSVFWAPSSTSPKPARERCCSPIFPPPSRTGCWSGCRPRAATLPRSSSFAPAPPRSARSAMKCANRWR